MILSLGEILYDMFPDGRRLGGAPYNFAHHLNKFGYPVRFVSRVGRDEAGDAILRHLTSAGFSPDDIGIDPDHDTGWVQVSLDGSGSPTFRITTGVAYDFIFQDGHAAALVEKAPELIYFGSLIQRTRFGFRTLHEILDRRQSGSRLFYDMNLREGCHKAEILEASLGRADILKLSDEELSASARLLGISGGGDALVEMFRRKFDISTVALTRGSAGSSLYMDDRRYSGAAEAGVQVADTVGAGDGYAAMLAAGILDGLQPETLVSEAARFSARLCTVSGAIPEDDAFYDEFRRRRG
jgi:fructokinase